MTDGIPDSVPSTAERILDVAETLIQTRGYSAFSYQDVADAVGIRKASIHHHFPTKEALGIAVIDRYAARFGARLATLAADAQVASTTLFARYTEPYLVFAESADRVCLCGALAAEGLALPPSLRARVDRFFEDHVAWLTAIFERGRQRGDLTLPMEPDRLAGLALAALQGALIVTRAIGDQARMAQVVESLMAQIAPRAP